MKTLDELRKEFERTGVYTFLHDWRFDFDDEQNKYVVKSPMGQFNCNDLCMLNGAWAMFKELNKDETT